MLKRVLVKSVHGAFGYVMEHYYPVGMEAEAAEQGALTDTYAVISIQDSHTQGFGVQFTENQFCKGVVVHANVTHNVYKENIDEIKNLANHLWRPMLFLQSKGSRRNFYHDRHYLHSQIICAR
jgi:hypothetical protein